VAHELVASYDDDGVCVALYIGPPDRCPEKRGESPYTLRPRAYDEEALSASASSKCAETEYVIFSPSVAVLNGVGSYSHNYYHFAWTPLTTYKECLEGPGGRCVDGDCVYGFR
jgi:hypothetical protein